MHLSVSDMAKLSSYLQADRCAVSDALSAKADASYVTDMEGDLKSALACQAAALAGKADRSTVAGANSASGAELANLQAQLAALQSGAQRLDTRVCCQLWHSAGARNTDAQAVCLRFLGALNMSAKCVLRTQEESGLVTQCLIQQ